MLTEDEKLFVQYWEANRLRFKSWKYQLLTGLPIGMLFALPILLLLITAKLWYTRADMMAHSIVNPYILIAAVVLIATFIAIFYKNHQWEMREQQYQALKAKERSEASPGPETQNVQQS